jgi:enhancer of mRNA-decapping protein 4
VTLISTEYGLHHHRQIAVSGDYICYGLRQGHIRVISRSSATRALLKGHTQPLSDLRFAPPAAAGNGGSEGAALLASGGADGRLFVWRLQLEEGAAAVHEAQQLRASFVSTAGKPGCSLGMRPAPRRGSLHAQSSGACGGGAECAHAAS